MDIVIKNGKNISDLLPGTVFKQGDDFWLRLVGQGDVSYPCVNLRTFQRHQLCSGDNDQIRIVNAELTITME